MEIQELKQLFVDNRDSRLTNNMSTIVAGIRHSYLENVLPLFEKANNSESARMEISIITKIHAKFLFNTVLFFYQVPGVIPEEYHTPLYLLIDPDNNAMVFGLAIYKNDTEPALLFSLEENLQGSTWGMSITKIPWNETRETFPIILCKDTFKLEDKLYILNTLAGDPLTQQITDMFDGSALSRLN